ncbi:hypothetical protein KHP07_03495 [Pseudomonas sp. VS40]|uniref:hypothetical protein n=1 Tax=unclassified Pseudomonas TaxID=196821 RepID=UPI001BDE4E4B|nr:MULTISPECIES: hypothetical protein [unclassified Pseudomonas]MBT1259415.1 hypothetical protein [Pseudomonas sp. VS40]
MNASALTAPVTASPVASALTSLIAPQSAPTPTNAGTADLSAEKDVDVKPRMQHQKLTSLGQTVLRGAGALFPTALHNNENKEKAPGAGFIGGGAQKEKATGAGLMVGGAAAQGLGKKIGSSGGIAAKAFGAGLVYLGKAAQEVGKAQYDNSGSTTGSTGSYNAYSPKNWKGSSQA